MSERQGAERAASTAGAHLCRNCFVLMCCKRTTAPHLIFVLAVWARKGGEARKVSGGPWRAGLGWVRLGLPKCV